MKEQSLLDYVQNLSVQDWQTLLQKMTDARMQPKEYHCACGKSFKSMHAYNGHSAFCWIPEKK